MNPFCNCSLQYEAFIYDCDGVLVDTEPLHRLSWCEMFRRHGLHFEPEELRRFIGLSAMQALSILLGEGRLDGCPPPEQLALERRGIFWEYIDTRLEAIRGVEAMLSGLSGRAPLALATGGPAETYLRILKARGWEGVFAICVGADDVNHPKPHPETYLRALEGLGLPAAKCLVFEDSAPGIASARAAGLDVVGVSSSHDEAFLLECGALGVLPDFSDGERVRRFLGGEA